MMFRRLKQLRIVEADGFYHGTQQVPSDPARQELAAILDQRAAEIRHASIDRLKALEARDAILTRRHADADAHWQKLQAETDGMPPEAALPFVALVLAGLAVGGETILLAPVMDGFGIADPDWQRFTATVLVLVSSGLVELACQHLRGGSEARGADVTSATTHSVERRSILGMVIGTFVTALAFTLIVVLGWWRAEEMIFAAQASHGAWATFLRENPTLTKLCVTLLTLGLPVFAAAAFDWGFSRLRYAWEWRRARRYADTTLHRLEHTKKQIESTVEKRDCKLAQLTDQGEAWQQAYLQHHALGQRIGARCTPLWQIGLNIAAVTVLIASACLLLDPVLPTGMPVSDAAFIALLTLGLTGLYAHHALKAWQRPTPLQLYRQRAIRWAESWSDHPEQQEPSVHKDRTAPVDTGNALVVFDTPARVAAEERKTA
jgi:hypothetical protein